eukprot:TRINITY_DN4469_c0_g1_i3.p1 TRINITY_DN4469_c0_g1~~TRINITY_DN4469_c0_g1_i3.p1  ORF type:complete len:486 (+),score=80.39 TRINITY_DN4469_c0_g1_i3:120-1577(+)
MGNKGTKLDNITIYVQTNQPYYSPNSVVDGSVYIEVSRPVTPQRLDLCLKGKERVKWVETRREDSKEITETKKDRKQIFNHTVTLYSFFDTLAQGQYQFPFTFQLPDYIPGSFDAKRGDHEGRVKYSLIAMLHAGMGDPVKHRCELVVRQEPGVASYNAPVVEDRPVSICCKNLGRCKLKCWFQSDTYQPGQEAMLMCVADNTLCQTPIKSFQVRLNQTLSFTARGHNRVFNHTVAQSQFPGIAGGANNAGNPALMSLRLEEQSAEKSTALQPNVHGQLVECKYSLEVAPVFDAACACCASVPSASLPLHIYGVALSSWTPTAPPNFHPQLFDQMQIIVPAGSLHGNIGLTAPLPMASAVSMELHPPAPEFANVEFKVNDPVKEELPQVSLNMERVDGARVNADSFNVEMNLGEAKMSTGRLPSALVAVPGAGFGSFNVPNNLKMPLDGNRSELAGPNPDGSLLQIQADSMIFSANMANASNASP